MPRRPTADTADRILDLAERLVQEHGFNGFSYADISAELGIRNASVHYHFPSKTKLGERLIARYREKFGVALDDIRLSTRAAGRRLRKYAALYAGVLRNRNRMCLCGMLAADFQSLPLSMRQGVKGFFDDNEAWLAGVLEEGRTAGSLRFKGPAHVQARLVLSSLEGAMLVSRPYGKVTHFQAVVERLFADLEAA